MKQRTVSNPPFVRSSPAEQLAPLALPCFAQLDYNPERCVIVMYTIIKRLDGKYHCYCQLQDGKEHYAYDTLTEAVRCCKKFAEIMNGEKNLKKKDITYQIEKPLTLTEFVQVDHNQM